VAPQDISSKGDPTDPPGEDEGADDAAARGGGFPQGKKSADTPEPEAAPEATPAPATMANYDFDAVSPCVAQ